MSRPTTTQPEQHGVTQHGQSPQVAVRDGNRLLCPCCGQVLMVLKEKRLTPPKRHHAQGDPRRTWPSLERLIAEQEAHYENGLTDEVDSPEAERSPQDGAAYKPPRDWNSRYEEHRRQRRKRPLEEATTYEMARLYAWAYYRLQRLAVQIEQEIATKEAEVKRLQTKLNGGQQETTHEQPTETPMNTKQRYEEKSITMRREGRPLRVDRTHAQADLGVAREMVNENRPGTRRHAHADEGMAPKTCSVEHGAPTEVAEERGPP